MQSDDFEFWKWATGIALAIASGLVGGGWAGRGVLEKIRLDTVQIQSKIAANVQRIDSIEARQAAQAEEIRHCVGEIRQGVAEIRQGVAVVSALHAETQSDVREIFARLNQRQIDLPHDEERRHG